MKDIRFDAADYVAGQRGVANTLQSLVSLCEQLLQENRALLTEVQHYRQVHNGKPPTNEPIEVHDGADG